MSPGSELSWCGLSQIARPAIGLLDMPTDDAASAPTEEEDTVNSFFVMFLKKLTELIPITVQVDASEGANMGDILE